jgi:hypothetical protein
VHPLLIINDLGITMITSKATSPRQVRNLWQYAKITGLGATSFDAAIQKVDEIHQLFCRTVSPGDTVTPPSFSPHKGDSAVDVHARYFTDRHSAPGLKHIPFKPDVNPMHILENLRGVKFIHAPDNDVQYCKKVSDDNGETM